MIFDNQSHVFAKKTTGKDQPIINSTSRILKFKLDEKNKKILDTVEIITGQNTDSLGSVYETEKDTYLVSIGNKKIVKKIKINEAGFIKTLWELTLELPTYRAHEDNPYNEK